MFLVLLVVSEWSCACCGVESEWRLVWGAGRRWSSAGERLVLKLSTHMVVGRLDLREDTLPPRMDVSVADTSHRTGLRVHLPRKRRGRVGVAFCSRRASRDGHARWLRGGWQRPGIVRRRQVCIFKHMRARHQYPRVIKKHLVNYVVVSLGVVLSRGSPRYMLQAIRPAFEVHSERLPRVCARKGPPRTWMSACS